MSGRSSSPLHHRVSHLIDRPILVDHHDPLFEVIQYHTFSSFLVSLPHPPCSFLFLLSPPPSFAILFPWLSHFLFIYSFIFLLLFFLFIARKAWQGQPLDFRHKTPPIKSCLSRYDNRVITDFQNGISYCISSFLSFLSLSFSLYISFLSSRSCLLDLFFSYFLLSLSFS